jgi:PTS system fructose-specific IIC component
VDGLNRLIRLPKNLAGLKPVLILPLLGSLLTGLVMIYAVGAPVAAALAFLTDWLRSMQGSSAILLGVILGAMSALTWAGRSTRRAMPSVGLVSSQSIRRWPPRWPPVVPLGIALATFLFRNRFTAEERSGRRGGRAGPCLYHRGRDPLAARDPFRIIPR